MHKQINKVIAYDGRCSCRKRSFWDGIAPEEKHCETYIAVVMITIQYFVYLLRKIYKKWK